MARKIRSLLIDAYAVGQLTEELVNRELRRVGVSPQAFALLSVIVASDPMTPTELSEVSGHPYTTLLDALDKLRDRRLVIRMPHPSDGRSYLVAPTRKGVALSERAVPAIRRSMEAIARNLPAGTSLAEVETSVRTLRRALNAALEDTGAGPARVAN